MNTISNMLYGGNNIAQMPSYGNIGQAIKPYTIPQMNIATPLPLNIATPLPQINDGGMATSGNFIQNFVNQMMNLASTFMQNMFALAGLSVQGGDTNPIVNVEGTQESSKGGFLNTIGNILGGLFDSNKTSGSSDSGFSLSNIWSSVKNIFGGLFGSSSNSSDSSSGGFLSGLWNGAKSIFGGLLGGDSKFSWGNVLNTAGSFIKDLF